MTVAFFAYLIYAATHNILLRCRINIVTVKHRQTHRRMNVLLLTIFGKINAAIKRYFKYRETVYQLSLLTSRDLQDLGINRCDIEFIARNSAKGLGR